MLYGRTVPAQCPTTIPRIQVKNECGQILVGFPVSIQVMPEPSYPTYAFWQNSTVTLSDGIGCAQFPYIANVPNAKVRFVPGAMPSSSRFTNDNYWQSTKRG